jgi:hypothetical protein
VGVVYIVVRLNCCLVRCGVMCELVPRKNVSMGRPMPDVERLARMLRVKVVYDGNRG